MAQPIISQQADRGNSQNTSSLWAAWWDAIQALRPAFAQARVFYYFVVIVAGMTVRQDRFGVSSIIRALRLKASAYHALLRNCHSRAIDIDRLNALWAQAVRRIFPDPLRVNGRIVLVGDGIKVAKRGKHMPGVKLLHQQSENKAEFIMGHSLQAVSMLVAGGVSCLAVPLIVRIHEGLVFSNRCSKTLLDKMIALLNAVANSEQFYFIADAYYAASGILLPLLDQGSHVITRVRHNAVGYTPYISDGKKRKGRKRVYGDHVQISSLSRSKKMQKALSPVYGEEDVTLQYCCLDLLWKPVGRLLRFVVVVHPTRGSCILMTTDLTLAPLEIIRLYGLRFKIEYSFKQAVHQIGAYAYHFWMQQMKPQRHGAGNQYLHRESEEYRVAIRRKLHAYHVFLQAGVIAQGLLQYLSVALPTLVWGSFGSWLRTIRPGIAPSEFVTTEALRQTLPQFLLSSGETHALAKFILERQDRDRAPFFARAA